MPEIMRTCLEEGMRPLPVTEEEKSFFMGFIPKEAYFDQESQLNALEKSRQALQQRVQELEADCKQKGKLAISLGVGAGLMLVIVFV